MKINLINFSQNRIYKKQEKAQKPAHVAANNGDFSLAQNIMSNYSKAMVSFGKFSSIDKRELEEYVWHNPEASQMEIAEYFGVSAMVISKALKRYNITYSSKRIKPIPEQELREYIAQNPEAAQKEIAEHFNVNPSSISTAIKKYKIEYSKKHQATPTPVGKVEKYIKENPDKSLIEIAKHFNTSVAFVKARMPKQAPKPAHKTLPVNEINILSYLAQHPNADINEVANYFKVTTTYLKPFLRKYNIILQEKVIPERPQKTSTKEKLEDYIAQNPEATLKEIAKHFGTSYQNILQLINKYGIEYERKINQKQIPKEVLENYIAQNPNKNQAEIAEHFGVNQSTISYAIKGYGITYLDKAKMLSISKEELENYIAQNPNENLKEIAKHFGVDDSTISNVLKRYGIKYSKKHSAPFITKEELKSYIEAHPNETLKEIAEHFNVGITTIANSIKRYGIEYTSKKPRGRKSNEN